MDPKEIWNQVLENGKKLKSCSSHDFSEDMMPDRVMGKRWKCVHCEGEVSGIDKHWYEQGKDHASK